MRLLEEQLPTFPNIAQFAPYHDLRCAGPVNTAFVRKIRLFKKDEDIDEDYKSVLLCLLTADPHKKKKDKDAVTENKKRSEAFKKRKAKVDISEHNEGGNAEENDRFLKYLREHDESYVLEYEKNLIPVHVRYEGDADPEKEGNSEREPRTKSSGGRNKGKHSLKEADRLSQKISENNFEKNDAVLDPECIRPNPTVKDKVDQYPYVDETHNVGNEETCGVNDSKNQVRTMLNRASPKLKLRPSNPIPGVGCSTSHVKPDPEHLSRHEDDRMRKGHTSVNDKINDQKRKDETKVHRLVNQKSELLVKNPKSMTDRKSRITTESDECRLERNVKLQDDSVCVERCSPSEFQRAKSAKRFLTYKDIDSSDVERCSSGEFRRAKAVKRDEDIDSSDVERCSSDEFGRAKAAKRFVSYKDIDNSDAEKCSSGEFRRIKKTYKDIDESDAEKEVKSESDSDVEFLGKAKFLKKDTLNPFESSKKYAKNMEEDVVELIGKSSASDEFRKKVLKVLKKPFDRVEYGRLLEAIRGGDYLDYHPDLTRTLKKQQHNWGRGLNLLRGFFFWLQNLTQGGSFKPWTDVACLAVEPPSPLNLPDHDRQ